VRVANPAGRAASAPAVGVEQEEGRLRPGLVDARPAFRDDGGERRANEIDGLWLQDRIDGRPIGLTRTRPAGDLRADPLDSGGHGVRSHRVGRVLRAAPRGYPSRMPTQRRYGAQSMSSTLRDVLVKRPGEAFARAFDDPAHGFLGPVDFDVARREHEAFLDVLAGLGPTVHVLETETDDPDLIYTFDPLLVTDRGAIPLRPGKPNRAEEPALLQAWTEAAGIPTLGRIEPPGTIEGGDTFWLRPDLFCIGRTLRSNASGVFQLADLIGGDVRVFDVPYWKGTAELIHLMSVISPVADDLAVVFLPLLPAGLWELLVDLDIRLIEVPEAEFPTLGCNVLAVRPGVVIMAEGNSVTAAALAAAGCEVHTYPATQIGINGSGGPTCMTRPILRD
jgi:dimethylargininase